MTQLSYNYASYPASKALFRGRPIMRKKQKITKIEKPNKRTKN